MMGMFAMTAAGMRVFGADGQLGDGRGRAGGQGDVASRVDGRMHAGLEVVAVVFLNGAHAAVSIVLTAMLRVAGVA